MRTRIALLVLVPVLAGAADRKAGELCTPGVACETGLVCTPRPGRSSICQAPTGPTTTSLAPAVTTTTVTPVGGTCLPEGGPCGTTGRACCAGLRCTNPGEETGRKCRVDTSLATTTTTTPSSGGATTTVPPAPPGPVSQIRLSPCHLGLRSHTPGDRRYDPRSGAPGNQYLARVMAEQKIHELMPRGMRIMRNTPTCAGTLTSIAQNARTNVPSRLFWRYGIRTLRGGQAYPFTVADYNHNYPHTFFRQFCGCVPEAEMSLEWKQVCSTATRNLGGCPPILKKQSGPMSPAGTLDPGRPGPPLTPGQCGALNAFVAAHHTHGHALMAHAPNTPALAAEVRVQLTAWANSARDTDQLALFDLFFTGDVDPLHTEAESDGLTLSTMNAMDAWQAAFNCDTGAPPVVERVNTTGWRHARAHYLRAVKLPGMKLAILCDGQIDQCGESDL